MKGNMWLPVFGLFLAAPLTITVSVRASPDNSLTFMGYLEPSTTTFLDESARYTWRVTFYGHLTITLLIDGSSITGEARVIDGTQEWQSFVNGEGGPVSTQHPCMGCEIPLTFSGRSMYGETLCVYAPLMFNGELNEDMDKITGIFSIRHTIFDGYKLDIPVILATLKPPVASFTYSPENPSVGEQITFDASSSDDPDGTIVGYHWDFGDGNGAEGQIVNHSYDKLGEYIVTLTVMDNDELTDSEKKTLRICCSTREARWHEIDFPDSPFWPGIIWGPLEAESHERIEVRWLWLPSPHYELRYYPAGSSKGFPIGGCNFRHGGNYAHYLAPDSNNDGTPDCFCGFVWNSWDFGYDGDDRYDRQGYLDRYVHTYDVCADKYSRILYLYFYPERCKPPVWELINGWTFKEECRGPYKEYARIVELDPSLAETEAIFEEFLRPIEEVSPDKITMFHWAVLLCDMDWDGDCDTMDFQIVGAALGKCWAEIGYCSLADIDGDGCVSDLDMDLIYGVSQPPLPENKPPVADAGDEQTIEQDSYEGAQVTLNGSSSNDDGQIQPLTYTWTWSGGSATGVNPTVTLPLGTTTVTLTVYDGQFSDTDTVDITVVDTTPPTIYSVLANPNVLWPANHKMVMVTITVDAEDVCDSAPDSFILGVTCNEKVNGPGDGNTESDWDYTDDPLVVLLRAERSGSGSGRVYNIYVNCVDASGNIATATLDVIVPHDQGAKGNK